LNRRGTIKLSIGAEGDSSYPKKFEEYDYDIDLLSNGVSYVTEAQTRTTRFLFGVAWLLNTTDENEYQTWYAADPTIM